MTATADIKQLDIASTALPGVKIITPKRFEDHRGFFSETYNKEVWEQAGFHCEFVQDNHSLSVDRGAVRGLHFQIPPFAQDKLVHVIKGSILDVAVDIRAGSPHYGQYVSVILSATEGRQIFIPAGFAHGFCTLELHTEVVYKVTNAYSPSHDKGLLWNDPDLGIDWPVSAEQAVLSDKDRQLPRLCDLPEYFRFDTR